MGIAEELAKTEKIPNSRVRLLSYTGAPSTDPSGTESLIANLLSVEINYSFDQIAATCTFTFAGNSPAIKPMDRVIVEQGYNGYYLPTFFGFIDKPVKARPAFTTMVSCRDVLKLAINDYLIDEIKFSAATHSVAERQGEAIVAYFLSQAGIPATRQSLSSTNTTFAQVHDASFQYTSAIEAIQQIATYLGWRVWSDPSGVVRFQYIRPVPAPTAFRTFDISGKEILSISYSKDDESLRNFVKVQGYDNIVSQAQADSDYVPNPPQYRKAAINNGLIDTQAMAEWLAARVLSDLNRLTEAVELEAEADPRLQIGMTVSLTEPFTGHSGDNYFVYGIRTRHDSKGYTMTISLVGGSASDYAASQPPIANFTYKVEQEYFANQSHFIVAVDASTSFDPDGSIASYSWSDGYTTKSGVRTTFVYDGITSPTTREIKLTVTDNTGQTAQLSRRVTLDADSPETLTRILYIAAADGVHVSQDGGQMWNIKALT